MKYYQVKPEYDQRRKGNNDVFIANELYTPAERKKYNAPDHIFRVLEIPRTKTYWCFGCRYAAE